MAQIIKLMDDNFEKEIIKSNIPTVVDFWAEWCKPCQAMMPIIDEIANEFNGKIKIAKINVDENNKIATNFMVMNIPTLIFFKKGEESDRLSGTVSKKKILEKINELFE